MTRREIPVLIAMLICLVSSGCSVFKMSRYESFGEWYVGPPGWDRGLMNESRIGIEGDRSWIFGHFRMPEVILQPAGGMTYPERVTPTNGSFLAGMEAQERANASGGPVTWQQEISRESGSHNALHFDLWDAGLLEIIPYRVWASDRSAGDKVVLTLVQPFMTIGNVSLATIRLPIYAVHDVIKLGMLPVAAAYYSGEE